MMQSNVELLVTGCLGIIGTVFLCVGIGIMLWERRLKRSCTLTCSAEVVDVVKQETHSVDDSRMISWYPVYEYSVNGSVHQKTASVGGRKGQLQIGQKVTIHVNPDNPDEFYCEKTAAGHIRGVFLGIGILMLVMEIAWLAVRCKL